MRTPSGELAKIPRISAPLSQAAPAPACPLLSISIGQGQIHPSLQPDFLPSTVAKEIPVTIIEKKAGRNSNVDSFLTSSLLKLPSQNTTDRWLNPQTCISQTRGLEGPDPGAG